jgi:hypothetical protein
VARTGIAQNPELVFGLAERFSRQEFAVLTETGSTGSSLRTTIYRMIIRLKL